MLGYALRVLLGLGLLACLPVSEGLLEWERVVNSARCRTRCLANLELPDEIHLLSKVKPSTSLVHCIEDTNCTACLKPCSQPFITLKICQTVCGNEPSACEQSCRFLHEVTTVRPGVCAPPTAAFDMTCADACAEDVDCDFGLKCCANGCGATCQLPTSQFDGMPEVPQAPKIRERPRGNSIEVKWDNVHENITGPVLYIVEARWNIGRHSSDSQMTTWQQVAQTTQTFSILRDVTPGYWYQYRVSAINLYGSKNPSPYTQPFTLSRDPRHPTAPQNLSEGDTNIMDGRIGVTVTWRPPRKSDLPVTRYKLFWSKRAKTIEEQLQSMKEFRHVLPGENLEYELPDLEPDTTYFVQAQAICQYGDEKLKSERASLYITTFPLPNDPQEQVQARSTESALHIEPLPTPAALLNLAVHAPFFQLGLLKANVSWDFPAELQLDSSSEAPAPATVGKVVLEWAPEVCIAADVDDGYAKTMTATTHDSFFVIYDLRFDCRYVIRAQSVSTLGLTGSWTHESFPTPSCSEVTVTGPVEPDCPTNVPSVPAAPADFQHSFLISSSNITARLSWRAPPAEGAAVTGYRVVWGTAMDDASDAINPTLNQNKAFTKVLGKTEYQFSMGNLKEAQTYVAQIAALSHAGAGQVVSLHFTTPMLQLAPKDPPYKHNKKDDKYLEPTEPPLPTSTTSPPESPPLARPTHQPLHHSSGAAGGGLLTYHVLRGLVACLLVCLLLH